MLALLAGRAPGVAGVFWSLLPRFRPGVAEPLPPATGVATGAAGWDDAPGLDAEAAGLAATTLMAGADSQTTSPLSPSISSV